MADLIRLNRTMAHIEANLSLWDQKHWARKSECGTTYCFAGWALQLEGIRICSDDCNTLRGTHVHRADVPDWVLERICRPRDILAVPHVARAVLNLKQSEAWPLFCGSSTLDGLRRQIRYYNTREVLTQ